MSRLRSGAFLLGMQNKSLMLPQRSGFSCKTHTSPHRWWGRQSQWQHCLHRKSRMFLCTRYHCQSFGITPQHNLHTQHWLFLLVAIQSFGGRIRIWHPRLKGSLSQWHHCHWSMSMSSACSWCHRDSNHRRMRCRCCLHVWCKDFQLLPARCCMSTHSAHMHSQ